MFSDETVRAIRKGWAVAAVSPDATARAFYAHLFQLDPETERLFHSDMGVQGRKLTETLAFIIDHLDDLDELMPAARDLAVRHVSYGVIAEHYTTVGQALIAALQDIVGDGFSVEDAAAWADVYGELSGAMIAATHSGAR